MKRNSLDFKCDSYFHNHGLFSPGRESVAIWKKSIPAFHFHFHTHTLIHKHSFELIIFLCGFIFFSISFG